MFRAVENGGIKALWVMATNPVVSLPRADAVRRALAGLELLVVSDNVFAGDTVSLAQMRLPAAGWGEKDGTVTNSERRISRQRPFLPLPGEAKPDWWIVSEVARRMGYADAFAYRSAAEVFARARGAVGLRERRRSRFRHQRLGRLLRRAPTTNCRQSNGPCEPVTTQPNGAFSVRAASLLQTGAHASSPCTHRQLRTTSAFRCGSTPAASATSGTR